MKGLTLMRINRLRQFRTYLSLFLTVVFVTAFVPGQRAQKQEQGFADRAARAQLHQALLDLTNPFTVLCVAAHPDDEDGSTLTVLRRKYGVHTVSLFSTYGEGGQNAVGPELYEELGVIRARETIAAAEVQGSEPHFLGMKDFGFSKSAEETFRAWGEKEALRRMVLQIRQLRPDVVITNHDTTSGHGHHQATGRLILQAFDAAADPNQFPEQLTKAPVWQVQRLFVRGFRGPQPAEATPAAPLQTFTIDPNETDPIRGITYAQQALAGLQKHATQGPWPRTVPPNGARPIRYNLVKQVQSAAPLPADAKTPIDGLQLPDAIRNGFIPPTIDKKPLMEFLEKPSEILISLINARKRGAFTAAKEVVAVDPQRFRLMSSRLDNALALAAGVALKADSEEPVLIPGAKTRISATLDNEGDSEVQVKRVNVEAFGYDNRLDTADKMLPETDTDGHLDLLTPKTTSLSVPSAEHLYDGLLFGQSLKIKADVVVDGANFSLVTEIKRDVTPPVEIVRVDPAIYVTTPATSQKPLEFKVRLVNHQATEFKGLVRIVGATLETGREISLLPHSSDVVNVSVKTMPVSKRRQPQSEVDVTVDLPIPKNPINKRAVPLIYADASVAPDLTVGYIPSFDETLAQSLSALGVEAKQLSVADISSGDLSKFSTIILDNRSYEAHHELIPVNDRLLKFVEDGGTLLVFYHKTNEWNPDERQKRPQLAPYPILLGDNRVTEEDAPIGFLQPRHPLLNFPNRITQADFVNWIQERGLYFPREWDSHYTALLTTNDKGEQPLHGGLLVAPYGKGNYIYTSLVWYRQLRAGIPGGYRFFANLISYGKGKPDASASTAP
jgi:LmbE family N-acetylglucosaminyl deacetylase